MWFALMLACQVVDPSIGANDDKAASVPDHEPAIDPADPVLGDPPVVVQQAPKPKLAMPDRPFTPYGTATTVGLQIAAGAAGACLVLGVYGWLLLTPGCPIVLLSLPLVVGASEVHVANRFGAKRSGLVAPLVVAAIGAGLVIGGVAVGFVSPTLPPSGIVDIVPQEDPNVLTAAVVVAIVGAVVMVVGPAVAYQVGAIDKEPDDRGEGNPTLWTPQPSAAVSAAVPF